MCFTFKIYVYIIIKEFVFEIILLPKYLYLKHIEMYLTPYLIPIGIPHHLYSILRGLQMMTGVDSPNRLLKEELIEVISEAGLQHMQSTIPLTVHHSETPLPRATCHTLAQLRTNKCPLLHSYLYKNDEDKHPSPLCTLFKSEQHTCSTAPT